MSRIGKAPITLPEGVEVSIGADNVVTVKGPKGDLSQAIDRDLKVAVLDGVVSIERPTEQKRHKAMHGLFRTLISNMVEGVTNGYKLDLELVGVGYRAQLQGRILDLTVGYSHNVLFELPVEVKASVESKKGQNPKVSLESTDKQLLGHIGSKIRSIRKPEPYKGKGIRYSHEYIRRKAGKTAAK
ncbi:MAG TPA: 50S ribosomal protein L6 [Bacteroidetes bacterium]|nr:50S ribosomal protein L6 [Bacteroidota bacterium]